MFRITKLIVKNYGPFKETVFNFNENNNPELAEVQMITGENGTGKSSVLYGLTLPENSQFALQRCHDQKGGSSIIEVHYSKGNPTIMTCVKGQIQYTSGNEIVQNKFLQFKNGTYRHNEFEFAMFSYSSYRNIHSAKIQGTQELHDSPVTGAMNFQQEDSRQLLQWVANMKSREANAHYHNQIKKRDQTKEATKRIENAIKAIIENPFEFIFNDDPIEVNVKVDNQISSFDVLPDGLKSILSWIGDMLMRLDRMPWKNNTPVSKRNLMLFLDEIDVHLHPKWQRQVLYIVQKLFPNAQIFVSTHSPFVVSSIGDAYIHELKKVNGYSKLVDSEITTLGNSYQRMINEIFSINSDFSPYLEKEIEIFYELKSKILLGDSSKMEEAIELASELSKISEEVHALLSFELKQLEKVISNV